MKQVQNCEVRNCIPTPSACVDWDGGDITYLGICNGDPLNTLLLEIVNKLENITGDDLSSFDLDSLLDLCNIKAPTEVSLINILNVVKSNQICFKDYVDNLSETLSSFLNQSKVNINLKCYQEFDNLGNGLNITRDQLDQLVINKLCDHENSISTVNGKITSLQSQIDELNNNHTVEELTFATCVDAGVKPTSSQVISVSQAHCDLEEATGSPSDIQSALSKVPSGWNTKYNSQPGWILNPTNQAEVINNLLIVIGLQGTDIETIQNTCCAVSCDDVKLGFSVTYDTDGTSLIIKFTSGAGTNIPSGFTDSGSTGTVTDIDGNVETFTLSISNNYEIDVPISTLNRNGDLAINISSKLSNGSLTCEKCLNKTVKSSSGCAYCEVNASCIEGYEDSYAIITYEI